MTVLTMPIKHRPDPSLDLVMERIVDVPRELVWRAWTDPELLKQWFTPAPWRTGECVIDLRPGGAFRTEILGPEGERFTTEGCYLEIVENEKLVWTTALAPGYRPYSSGNGAEGCGAPSFTAVITLEEHEEGSKYTALVIHGDQESRDRHGEMGFHDGWGKAFDQLVELVKR
jgi:uncharacterized protein YndB with AHSA1/START domain